MNESLPTKGEKHFLVEKGELELVLRDLEEKQLTVITDLEKCLPLLQDVDLQKKMQIQLKQAQAQLRALQAGYVPVDAGWFWDIDTKAKWGKKVVKDVLDTMPIEVKEKMEEAKASGTFEKIKVTGSRRGDPLLVGTAGKKNFLLAMWCNLANGYSVGFTMRGR